SRLRLRLRLIRPGIEAGGEVGTPRRWGVRAGARWGGTPGGRPEVAEVERIGWTHDDHPGLRWRVVASRMFIGISTGSGTRRRCGRAAPRRRRNGIRSWPGPVR